MGVSEILQCVIKETNTVKVTVSSKITVRISFTQSFQCFNCCATYTKRVEEKSKGGNTS